MHLQRNSSEWSKVRFLFVFLVSSSVQQSEFPRLRAVFLDFELIVGVFIKPQQLQKHPHVLQRNGTRRSLFFFLIALKELYKPSRVTRFSCARRLS